MKSGDDPHEKDDEMNLNRFSARNTKDTENNAVYFLAIFFFFIASVMQVASLPQTWLREQNAGKRLFER